MFRSLWYRMVRRQTRKSKHGRQAARRSFRAARPWLECLENRWAPAGMYTVTNLSDAVVPPSGMDLRQACNLANIDAGATIQFAPGLNGTITLVQGDLDLIEPTTVNATGHNITISAAGGDRIYDISTAGTVTLINLTLQNGQAPAGDGGGNGGAIYDANAASILVLNNDRIELNHATGSGGGVYSEGMVRLTNTVVEANSAPNHAGGIYAGRNFTASDSTISDNTAATGGGIFEAGTGSTVSLTGSSVIHNRATRGNGGGVWAQYNVTANGGQVTDNVAVGGNGGGIYSDGGDVMLNGTTVATNTSTMRGGGVFADFNVFLSGGAHVMNNIGNTGGGGIWTDEGFALISGSTVSGNTAGAGSTGGSGGGVWSGTDVLVAGGTVSGNTANGNGGGILALRNVSLSGGSAVSGNIAVPTDGMNGNGGGIFAVGDVTVTGSSVRDNNTGRDGGGIHATGNVFLFAQASVAGNHAGRDGGGIWGGPASNVSIIASTVSDNTTAHNGGGVFLAGTETEESGSLFVSSGSITGNTAFNEGGGVYVANVESVTVLGSNIEGNTASMNGGGVSSHDVINLSIIATNIVNNDATSGSGGGVYVVGSGSNADLDSDQILGNTAGLSGGGVYVAVDMAINNVTFDNNVSFGGPQTGSALFAASGANVILSNDDFDDTMGLSALLSTQLINCPDGGIFSAGGNEVGDASWVNIAGFSPELGDHGNA